MDIRNATARYRTALARQARTALALGMADGCRNGPLALALEQRLTQRDAEVAEAFAEVTQATAGMTFAQRMLASATEAELAERGWDVAALKAEATAQ